MISIFVTIGDFLQRRQRMIAAVLLAFVLASGVGRAATSFFTYDEQITWRTGRLPLSQLWNFFASGLDTTGPVAALLVHPMCGLKMSPEIAARIPFIAAFAVMCWGIWSFLSTRYPASFALVGIILPLNFVALMQFRTDARAYALMLCAAGAGMRFWQMTADRRARPWSILGLWFVMAIGTSGHFFTIFLFIPFALGQCVLDWKNRSLDIQVWAALLLFPAAWIPFMPGERTARAFYGSTFWSKAQIGNLSDPYEHFLSPNWAVLFTLGLYMLVVMAVLLLPGRASHKADAHTRQIKTGLRLAEWAMLLGMLVLPLAAWCASFALGAFHPNYTISFMAGMMVLIVAAAAELSSRRATTGVVLFVMIGTLTLADENLSDLFRMPAAIMDSGGAHESMAKLFQKKDWVAFLDKSGESVAADNATYANLLFYAESGLAQRSYALTMPSANQDFPGAMTDVNNMRLFGRYLGYKTAVITDFEQEQSRFFMVQRRPGYTSEWMASYILATTPADRMQVRLLSRDEDIMIFEVCSPGAC